jgi:hypothetical protein
MEKKCGFTMCINNNYKNGSPTCLLLEEKYEKCRKNEYQFLKLKETGEEDE